MRRIIKPITTVMLTLLLLLVSFTPVSQVEAQSGMASACGATYTVQLGNTLTGIAQSCGVNYAALLAANPGIVNANLIFPAQVINIPTGTIPNTGGQGRYTIVVGDTMSQIARTHAVTLAALAAANPGITNLNLIFPGQVINIPATGGTVPNTGATPVPTATPNVSPTPATSPTPAATPGIPNTGGGRFNYTVVAGDTLYSISNRFGTTVVNIMAINPSLANMNLIYPGQVLAIP